MPPRPRCSTASIHAPPLVPPRRERRVAVGFGAAAITALAAVAPAPASATVSFSTAPNAPNLPSVTLNGQAKTLNATMANWGVTQTTIQSEWNVTVQGDTSAGKSAVFKVYCPNASCGTDTGPAYVTGGSTLAANSLKLSSTAASWITRT